MRLVEPDVTVAWRSARTRCLLSASAIAARRLPDRQPGPGAVVDLRRLRLTRSQLPDNETRHAHPFPVFQPGRARPRNRGEGNRPYLWQKYGCKQRVLFITVPFEEVVAELLGKIEDSQMG